ncbi:MAG: lysophospholipase/glycerophospholipid:cholesterol acyltransferase PlaC [Legionellales bacterium]
MFKNSRICRWFSLTLPCIPLVASASMPIPAMVVFGDSLSDTGNTTHLLKSIRQEEDPAYLVAPFKTFVLNKMTDYAEEYYVPQMVLDAGIELVTEFFDKEMAPYIANLITQVRLVSILPGKPYWNARFSNGKVWNEYLANMLSLPMDNEATYINKAFGGSWASTYDYQLTVWNLIRHPLGTIKTLIVGKLIPPSLGLTVQAYLLEHQKLDSQTVYFIASGANDYLNVLQFEDNYNPEIMSAYINIVLDNLSASVRNLANAGARHFVIMGIPHLGETPKYVHTLDKDVLNMAADNHNDRLLARIENWKEAYPDADFLFIDIQDYLAKALAKPLKYGFTNSTDACIDVAFPMFDSLISSPFAKNYVLHQAQLVNYTDKQFASGQKNYTVCSGVEGYLFWDDVHPSTRAHSHLAFETCNAMKEHGYEVSCKLLK